jgi:hypothetical protein
VVGFSALIWFIGTGMGHTLSLSRVLPLALVVVLAVAAVILPSVLISLAMGQWALRHGGTDAQWFWFPSEPRGLVQQRDELAALEREARG